MARSRRGGKATVKPKNVKSPEDGEGSHAVDETYVVAETDGLNGLKTAPSTISEVKVTVEKCDAILVKHKSEDSEGEDSFVESENEDEDKAEVVPAATAAVGMKDEVLSEDESEKLADEEGSVNDRSADSEEFDDIQNASAVGSERDGSSEEQDEDDLPLRSIKPKLSVTSAQQLDASKKSKKNYANKETEKASTGSNFAPVKATGTSRNPGKVASVAEKKKQSSSTSKSAGPKNTATESKTVASKVKEVGSRSKPLAEKPFSEAKKDMIIDLLMDGLSKHDERKGVSIPTIKKYVVENDSKARSWSQLQPRVRKALDNALEEGKILRPKGNEHMNGMVGRFKVNKKYQAKKISKKLPKSLSTESPPRKAVASSKPTKSSAVASKTKKVLAGKEEVLPKENKGKLSMKSGPKRSLQIFSTDDSEEEFQEPNPIKAKGNRRKSKSGGAIVKANSKGPPKPKTMKRSHSAENVSVPTHSVRGRPKSKK